MLGRGRIVAIQAATCSSAFALPASYVNFAMNKVNMLRYHGIIPYIVFDGGHLPAKGKTEVEREK
jgi:hypothetical protein